MAHRLSCHVFDNHRFNILYTMAYDETSSCDPRLSISGSLWTRKHETVLLYCSKREGVAIAIKSEIPGSIASRGVHGKGRLGRRGECLWRAWNDFGGAELGLKIENTFKMNFEPVSVIEWPRTVLTELPGYKENRSCPFARTLNWLFHYGIPRHWVTKIGSRGTV